MHSPSIQSFPTQSSQASPMQHSPEVPTHAQLPSRQSHPSPMQHSGPVHSVSSSPPSTGSPPSGPSDGEPPSGESAGLSSPPAGDPGELSVGSVLGCSSGGMTIVTWTYSQHPSFSLRQDVWVNSLVVSVKSTFSGHTRTMRMLTYSVKVSCISPYVETVKKLVFSRWIATCVASISMTPFIKPVGLKFARPRKVSTVCSTPTVPFSCPALVRRSTSSSSMRARYCLMCGSTTPVTDAPGELSMPLNAPTWKACVAGRPLSKVSPALGLSGRSMTAGTLLTSHMSAAPPHVTNVSVGL
mmetsp:Transcript_28055/g.57467  ORF Transcript_28055/g.57467 Transcript_28055/m.57467 type:complete len:298 (-) Transcript_28055:932-1825(-)